MADVVTVVSSDDKRFTVLVSVAEQSVTLKHLIKDAGINDEIPLVAVDGRDFERIINYCTAHKDAPPPPPPSSETEPILEADAALFADLDHETMLKLILATNYLDVKPLLNLLCRIVANTVVGKKPEEIFAMFGLSGQMYTPEEEEQVRKENPWLEDQ
jgi:S-phase kinase-associated protein 1